MRCEFVSVRFEFQYLLYHCNAVAQMDKFRLEISL